jgi:hypothetical protein
MSIIPKSPRIVSLWHDRLYKIQKERARYQIYFAAGAAGFVAAKKKKYVFDAEYLGKYLYL